MVFDVYDSNNDGLLSAEEMTVGIKGSTLETQLEAIKQSKFGSSEAGFMKKAVSSSLSLLYLCFVL